MAISCGFSPWSRSRLNLDPSGGSVRLVGARRELVTILELVSIAPTSNDFLKLPKLDLTRKNIYLFLRPAFRVMTMSSLVRPVIGLAAKAFLISPLCSVQVHGLSNIIAALNRDERNRGRGVLAGSMTLKCFPLRETDPYISVSNHISV